jgi:hypothetical protein
LAEDAIKNLQLGLKELVERGPELLSVTRLFEELVLTGKAELVEAELSERFAPIILTLTRLVEANEDQARQATVGMHLSDAEQVVVLEVRKSYLPFKPAVQSAAAFEQGYINRVTGVRYRPLVFLLTNQPALDFTLRSFDKNVLRIADSIDSVMGLIAGIAQTVAAATEKIGAMNVQMPEETSKAFFEQVDRAMEALARIKKLSEILARSGTRLPEQH